MAPAVGGGLRKPGSSCLIRTRSLFDLAWALAVLLWRMLITWMGRTARGHSKDKEEGGWESLQNHSLTLLSHSSWSSWPLYRVCIYKKPRHTHKTSSLENHHVTQTQTQTHRPDVKALKADDTRMSTCYCTNTPLSHGRPVKVGIKHKATAWMYCTYNYIPP